LSSPPEGCSGETGAFADPRAQNDFDAFFDGNGIDELTLLEGRLRQILLDLPSGMAAARSLFQCATVTAAAPTTPAAAAAAVATVSAGVKATSASGDDGYDDSSKSSGNVVIFGRFCGEGDNRDDGQLLAADTIGLLETLKLLPTTTGTDACGEGSITKLSHPESWERLFGAPIGSDTLSMIY
jgi:hypothetical protein